MIRFACSCGKQLQVREDLAGKRVACPGCKQVLLVPAPQGHETLDEVGMPDTPRPRSIAARPRNRPEGGEREAKGRDYSGPPGRSGKATASLVLGLTSVLCNVFTGLLAVVFGLLALLDISRSGGRLQGKGFAVTGILLGVFWSAACIGGGTWGIFYARKKATESTARLSSRLNLLQITLAMHNYNSLKGWLPPAAICDKAGKPLLSWRVDLLPHLNEDSLYRQFRLNEPWDSPHNKQLLGRMPSVYKLPDAYRVPPNETVYQVFVGNGAAFDINHGYGFPADFSDGTSNTILVVEAGRSVPWTKPDDLPFDPNAPLPALGGLNDKALVGLADGSVKALPTPISDTQLRPLITRSGNDTVNWAGIE
jgi:hypothetical protein